MIILVLMYEQSVTLRGFVYLVVHVVYLVAMGMIRPHGSFMMNVSEIMGEGGVVIVMLLVVIFGYNLAFPTWADKTSIIVLLALFTI